jgi:hypothetical protein
MKKQTVQQEILFFTGTTFAQKEFEVRNQAAKKPSSLEDALEQAFWDGMIFEMLPELDSKHSGEERKFLWQINNYSSSLWMNMSSVPMLYDQHTSLDPYQFVKTTIIN